MKLTFLGTRGEINAGTRRHRMHSSLLVSSDRDRSVMIDCGLDWIRRLSRLHPDAIVLTHAHPDHAGGLKNGAQCPVYATAQTWIGVRSQDIETRVVIRPQTRIKICGITFEAFPVEHSIRAPAVGYRVTAAGASIFYVPDLVRIYDRTAALRGIQYYIGAGASLTRPIPGSVEMCRLAMPPFECNWISAERKTSTIPSIHTAGPRS